MKQKVLFIILNEYTDWEGAFLSTALHVGVIPGGEIKYEVHTIAPTSDAVRSIGGFRTLPDYSFENMPKDYAALVLSVVTVGTHMKQNLSYHWYRRLWIKVKSSGRYATVLHSYVHMVS